LTGGVPFGCVLRPSFLAFHLRGSVVVWSLLSLLAPGCDFPPSALFDPLNLVLLEALPPKFLQETLGLVFDDFGIRGTSLLVLETEEFAL